jgi:hypothetical protein
MIKKTITYVDFEDRERTEDFHFNMTSAELRLWEAEHGGRPFKDYLQEIVANEDRKAVVQNFKEIIQRSVGEKSVDGKRFIKNDDIRDSFLATNAFAILFEELMTQEGAAAAFINGIIPQGGTPAGNVAPQTARERSEAQMQGHRKPAQKSEQEIHTVSETPQPYATTPAPTPEQTNVQTEVVHHPEAVELTTHAQPLQAPQLSKEQMEQFFRDNPDAAAGFQNN